MAINIDTAVVFKCYCIVVTSLHRLYARVSIDPPWDKDVANFLLILNFWKIYNLNHKYKTVPITQHDDWP